MSEADKLFQELGYDEKYYYKEGKVYEEVESYKDSKKCNCIQFDIFNKTFCKFNADDSEDDLDFSMQELKAINKKCEEMGWIEE